MDKEIWVPIKDYEGLYEVSSHGRVKSLDRVIIFRGHKKNLKGKILSQANDKDGYKKIRCSENGVSEEFKVHRLTCSAFHENPENKPQVNHKDGIKWHNWESNLEWSTGSENMKHSFRMGLQKQLKNEDNKRSIPVVQLSLSDSEINEFPSAMEGMRQTGIAQGHISSVCRGERNKAGGFEWRYKND